MRDRNDPKEHAIVHNLKEAFDYLGAPLVVTELARILLARAAACQMGEDVRNVYRERARLLLQAAHEMGPSCCPFHKDGGPLLDDCGGPLKCPACGALDCECAS